MHSTTLLRLCAASLFACVASAQVSYYSVSLDGTNEVPANATTGGGYGIVRLEEPANTVRIFVEYFGLTGAPAAAHMHLGAAGINGGVIIGLAPGVPNTFTGGGVVPAAQVVALKTNGMYLNVHTAAFPGGEIRGQVVEPTSTRFTALMSGAQEVPPTPSAATGTAVGWLHMPDQRFVYMVNSAGLAGVTAAHLHIAAAGINGPVVFPLNGGAGTYCGVSPRLTDAEVTALNANGTYMNIHTAAFPGGEIRGQMLRDLGTHFVASLDGLSEVPPNPSPGLGAAQLVIGANGTAQIIVSFGGLVAPTTASHIHTAPVGVNGPVTIPLALVGGQFVATFTPTTAQLLDVRNGNWYVNIHTTAFPGGEIRGQLRAATLPTTFGPACVGTPGRPEIGATRFPCVGASVDIDCYGTPPGGASFLIFGLNRDNAGGGAPLPLAFTAVGLNAPCFFLLDPIATQLTFANALGCATLTWNTPFNPGLRGLNVYTQWVLLDPPANPAGFVASNALTLTVQ